MNAVPQPARGAESAIRHFHVNVPEAKLTDLRKRINATVWPEQEPDGDASQGVRLATIQKLADYWATEYNWRKIERKLNSVPNFITEIDGLDIQFIHVRSKHEEALPLIVTHGWPGSIVEQLKIIEPLTNPTAHGGSAADAFHVVIPSRPGCGFSGKPTATGWDCPRIARAWAELMGRLGYTRYVAQGGDWGAFVTEQMGAQAPAGLLGIHTNLACAVPTEIAQAFQSGNAPAGLAADESRAFHQLAVFLANSLSYAQQMATHPVALYGIADSPVGLAAWYLDNDLWTHGLIEHAFDGQPDSLTRDDLLDNITLTWLTNSAISSTRLYRENKLPFFAPMGIEIPVAVSTFAAEIYQVPRSWAERAYPKLVHYNKVAKGGHFAAWEQPKLFCEELRAGFRTLRA
ncbi:MAG TPA: epoxide hydrolase [Steroidobacteraceae bacterium]|nr:epoxide hydrolase [Steroidobacteraceae bacterium]